MAMSTTGSSLERIRRKKGITLEQISDSTKISKTFLRAIESEEFEKLPGGIFDSNYLRQYAAEAGIDESIVMERYSEYQAERERKENPPPPQDRRSPALRWLLSLVTSQLA